MRTQHPCQGAHEALIMLGAKVRFESFWGPLSPPPAPSQQLTDYRKWGCFLWGNGGFFQSRPA